MTETNPTNKNYDFWCYVYDRCNSALFNDLLPGSILTFQRQRDIYGFHAASRFEASDSPTKIDEIALNPSYFDRHDARYILSVLVHEMAHQYQWHFGKPGQNGYHNKAWARLMIDIGLVPTDTGEPGGKATGRHVQHFIRPDGPFDRFCTELLNEGLVIPYKETNFWEAMVPVNLSEEEKQNAVERLKQAAEEQRKKKAASKSRYTCPNCHPLIHVWGKPDLRIDCGECGARFELDPTGHSDLTEIPKARESEWPLIGFQMKDENHERINRN